MGFDKWEDIIEYCEKNQIKLWAENDKLKYKTTSMKLKPELLLALKENKKQLIEHFCNNNNKGTLEIDTSNKFEVFPLTDVQSAYMLGRKDIFEYGKVACHIYLEIEYEDLDIKKVQGVWESLILTHDMLRSVIYENGTQQVLEEVPKIKIEYIDLIGHADSLKKLEQLKKDMGEKVYELGKWPMFGLGISKESHRSVLHLSMDFLIADWASIWMILNQFENMYFKGVKPKVSTELKFRDYVIGEKRLKKSEQYQRDAEYWVNRIDKFFPAPSLPLIRNAVDNIKFERHTLRLEPNVWNKFKKIAVNNGTTPTIAVLAAYCDIIYRWSKNKEFCINLTVLNRMDLHPDVNEIIGDFTSINLLEINDYSKERFSYRAKMLNKQLFEDLDHRLFSGVEVIRELTRRRGGELSIMPIVFTSAIGLADSDNQMVGKLVGGITQTPQTFIDCQVMDGNFGLQINWDVREGIFPQNMIKDMFKAFEDRLNLLSNSEESWESVLNIDLPKYQNKFITNKDNDLNSVCEDLLYTKFLRNVQEHPNETAVIDHEGTITYLQLHQKASRLAKEIMKAGVNKSDVIPILISKGKNQVIAVLGALYMGGVYVPIDLNQPSERVEKILKDLNTKLVLVDNNANKVHGYSAIDVNTIKEKCNDETELPVRVSCEEPAYIIYTSGSTGEPKGVIISHKGAMNTINDINNRYMINKNDRILGISKLNFDLSVYDIFGMLSAGGAIVYFSEKDYMNPSVWFDCIVKYNITIWNSVPALMKMLLTHVQTLRTSKAQFPIRQVLLSGDWIPLDMPEELRKINPNIKISCLGGATEASIWSIFHDYEGVEPQWVSIPYGKPLKDQGFRILDSNMLDCPVWVSGNIYITGIGLAEGYYNDELLTKEKFLYDEKSKERMYKTGDLGRYLPNGEIEFLGREDNQVKIRGNRIELGEIEQSINQFPGIYTSVACVSNTNGDNNIVAVIEPEKHEENKGDYTVIDRNYVRELLESLYGEISNNYNKREYTKDSKAESENVLEVNNIEAEYFNQCMCNIIKDFVQNNTAKKIKILEIGAGIGATTEKIIRSIENFDYEYDFTDISKDSMVEAKKIFYGNKKIKFKVFDMDKDFLEQGVIDNTYDIVISSYVLDNAKDIRKTLENIEKLILPGGIMIGSIPIKDQPRLAMSQALVMNRPEDNLRDESLFLSSKEWVELFNERYENTIALSTCIDVVKGFTSDLFIKQYKTKVATINIGQLFNKLKNSLPNYMVPAEVLLIDNIPLNINGKLDRKNIQSLVNKYVDSNKYIEDVQGSYNNNKYEIELIKIWKEVLKKDNLNRKDNFFDYGADSLVMAQVATKIKNQMQVKIPFDTILRYMLNNPTVEKIALFIEEELNNSKDMSLETTMNSIDNKLNEGVSYFNYYEGTNDKKDTLIVLIHGGLGSIESFKYLGKELANQNIGEVVSIGLKDFDKYTQIAPNEVIDFLTDEYSKNLIETGIRNIQLVGYSSSGILAIEIAKRLVEYGINVEQLAIIDGGSLELEIEDELIYELLFIVNLNVTFMDLWGIECYSMEEFLLGFLTNRGKLTKQKAEYDLYKDLINGLRVFSQIDRFKKYAKISNEKSGNAISYEFVENLYRIFVQSFKALNYVTDPYFGDINYYATKEKTGLFKKFNLLIEKKDEICIGKFEIKEVNGNHYTCLENKIYAKELASLLKSSGEK